jgi:hypothetical protein
MMRSLTEEINHQVKPGRRTVYRSMGEIRRQFRGADLPRVRVFAAGALIAALAAGAGVVVYRRRRQRPLARRLQDALPGSIRHPAALRGQLRRPLERAVRAL